jgi:hypothetical protein
MSFGQKGTLKRHFQMTHQKKKNCKCDLCEFSAYEHDALRKHIECVHEKLKPH